MLSLFNTCGRKMEPFEPVNPLVVNIFTCGPSVYQRAHIGNYRTFLFEDVLVRYLQFLGYTVRRGMIFTDVEDKAIAEAEKRRIGLKPMTERNIKTFVKEMQLLRMKIPDYLARASEAVDDSVDIIADLLKLGIAYRFRENIYFDPLRYARFGSLYGLDMSKWPKEKRRFHKDTYPGMRWNRGDFILWHACTSIGDACWESPVGSGRPAWNIQDASVLKRHIDETLSIYCGGIDNLIRHHDYTMAILESIRPYPMARCWMHCHHLYVEGKKMSKSLGNIYYADTLLKEGFSAEEIRFFMIYGHYRSRLNYSEKLMHEKTRMLRKLGDAVISLEKKAVGAEGLPSCRLASELTRVFTTEMDEDLNVKGAFDGFANCLTEREVSALTPKEAASVLAVLRRIDSVLQVIF